MATEKDRVPLASEASHAPMPAGAVFLSYASEDAEAAQRIATALRTAGVEVWFDREELRGGDAWDRRIREQIHDCRLFVAVISAHTEARDEGYFRREWKLAVDRTHDMDEHKAFLVPVVIDATSERGAHVPEKFHEVQWTRLPGGETPPAFVERIRRLLTPDASPAMPSTAAGSTGGPVAAPSIRRSPLPNAAIWIAAAIVALVCAYFVADKLWLSKYSVTHTPAATPGAQPPAPSPGTAAAFNPPPHSIAVLPFVNMSGDAKQEYFSDGLSEELLNALSRIDELQVAARTSSFSFKGKDVDIGTIARRLNVGAVLEGSIRRSGNTVRVTTQLVNAVTGFHMWSQTYDRDLKNILVVETDIATAVAQQLQVRLLGGEAAKIEVGGTRNPQAYDAYLHGVQLWTLAEGARGFRLALEPFDKAIALDPNFARAHAWRAWTLSAMGDWTKDLTERASAVEEARKAAERAVALAPDLGEAHLILGAARMYGFIDLKGAAPEYERALALAPGSAVVQRTYAIFAGVLGHREVALAAAKRAVTLDPQNYTARWTVVRVLRYAHQFHEALAATEDAKALNPSGHMIGRYIGEIYLALGQPERALQHCAPASAPLEENDRHQCLALAYHALGRGHEAESELKELKRIDGEAGAFDYAEVYAQWGNTAEALRWLATAERVHGEGLQILKVDWLLDPIRNEPDFKALERRLDFPP